MTDTPKRTASPRPNIVNVPSIVRTRYKRQTDVERRIDLGSYEARTQPCVVAADLSRGSLETLPGYITKHQGIPDLDVAMRLLKMINGSAEESQFRLAVIRHPELMPNAKRKSNKSEVPTPRAKDREIVAWYDKLKEEFGKGEAVVTHMLTVSPSQSSDKKAIGNLSRSVVKEALRRVRHEASMAKELARRIEETMARREVALAKMRATTVAQNPVPTASAEPLTEA